MFWVTNRELIGPSEFGASYGSKPDKCHVAVSEMLEDKIETKIIEGDAQQEEAFLAAAEKTTSCLIFIHGFNNTYDDAVETGAFLSRTYGVSLMGFSWPSEGNLEAYFTDRKEAWGSHKAFENTLLKVSSWITKNKDRLSGVSFNLMFHSMGNYLLKSFMEHDKSEEVTRIFDDISLIEADVAAEDHRSWCRRIQAKKHVYISINLEDYALAGSSILHDDHRLSDDLSEKKCSKIRYIDLTGDAGISHSPYYSENTKVKAVFLKLFLGQDAVAELHFWAKYQVYRLDPPSYWERMCTMM